MHAPTKARLTKTVGASNFRAQGRVNTDASGGARKPVANGQGALVAYWSDPRDSRQRTTDSERGSFRKKIRGWYYNGIRSGLEREKRDCPIILEGTIPFFASTAFGKRTGVSWPGQQPRPTDPYLFLFFCSSSSIP